MLTLPYRTTDTKLLVLVNNEFTICYYTKGEKLAGKEGIERNPLIVSFVSEMENPTTTYESLAIVLRPWKKKHANL